MRLISWHARSIASSQLMTSHSSLPRFSPLELLPPPGCQPLRLSGCIMRSAPKHCCCWALPRTQPRCCGYSGLSSWLSSVFWRTTAPSFTMTLFTQRPPQLCQQAALTHVPPSSGFTASVFSVFLTSAFGAQPNAESAAAPAATAMLPCINLRRLMPVSVIPISPPLFNWNSSP